MSHNSQKKVAVINDFSGFGRCSIAVQLPILSAMGMQCCPLPTAVFSNHTGFPSFAWTDYTDHMAPYMEQWKKLDLEFNAISSGFLGSHRQIELVEHFFQLFKTPKTVAVVDPVMGDYGKLYRTYSMELVEGLKTLVHSADILTPNLTEACLLTNRRYDPNVSERELGQMCEELCSRGEKKIVISGLFHGDELGNYVFEAGCTPRIVRERRVGSPRSGTGDVFCAIITGCAVNGVSFVESVERASSFVARSIVRSEELGIPTTDGIAFEELLGDLIPRRP